MKLNIILKNLYFENGFYYHFWWTVTTLMLIGYPKCIGTELESTRSVQSESLKRSLNDSEFKDSPIYFINKYSKPSLLDNLKATLNTTSIKKSNKIFRLPLKFLSNAKPTDVVTDVFEYNIKHSKLINNESQVRTQVNKAKNNTKLIFLPIKLVSNGKPSQIRVYSL